jgi:hypothetical protein
METGGIYRIKSRNLSVGVYDGKGGFIGIREKFGDTYLFTEYGWEQGPPYGTVRLEDRVFVGRVPPEVPLVTTLGTRCRGCGQDIEFRDGEGWVGCGGCEKVLPMSVPNKVLYKILYNLATPEEIAAWEQAKRGRWASRSSIAAREQEGSVPPQSTLGEGEASTPTGRSTAP